MGAERVKVAVNGYGVIGRRIADAVACMPDMDLAGVVDVATDYHVRFAERRGYNLFASTPEALVAMREAGLNPQGLLDDLLRQTDVVVDCTPVGIGARNKPAYERAGVKMIFQGGETHEVAGYSFVGQVNYGGAVNRDAVRVVSCNTTALCRTVNTLEQRGWVKKARVVLFRRGTDPWESHINGLINTVEPETAKIPSHQTPDAGMVLPNVDILTMSAKGPVNLGHIHFAMVEAPVPVDRDEAVDAFRHAARIAFVSRNADVEAMNSVAELMREMYRPRGDMWEVALWLNSVRTIGNEIVYCYQVDNEAIVIPENIDAIRAVTGAEPDGARSIEKTDSALGITGEFLPERVLVAA